MNYQNLNKYLIILLLFISEQKINCWPRTTHPEFDCTPYHFLGIFKTSCTYTSYEYTVECCCERQQKAYKKFTSTCYQCRDLPEDFWSGYVPGEKYPRSKITPQCSISENDDNKLCSLSHKTYIRIKRGPGNRNIAQYVEAEVFLLFMGFIIAQLRLNTEYQSRVNTLISQERALETAFRINDGICEDPERQSDQVINFGFLYDPDTGTVLNVNVSNFVTLNPTQQYITLLKIMINAFRDHPPVNVTPVLREFKDRVHIVANNRLDALNHFNDKLQELKDEESHEPNTCTIQIRKSTKSQENHYTIYSLWNELNMELRNYIALNTVWTIEQATTTVRDELKK